MCIAVLMYGLFSGQVVNYRNSKMEKEEKAALKIQKLEEFKVKFDIQEVLYQNLKQKFTESDPESQKRAIDISMLSKDEIETIQVAKMSEKFKSIPLFSQNPAHEVF